MKVSHFPSVTILVVVGAMTFLLAALATLFGFLMLVALGAL